VFIVTPSIFQDHVGCFGLSTHPSFFPPLCFFIEFLSCSHTKTSFVATFKCLLNELSFIFMPFPFHPNGELVIARVLQSFMVFLNPVSPFSCRGGQSKSLTPDSVLSLRLPHPSMSLGSELALPFFSLLTFLPSYPQIRQCLGTHLFSFCGAACFLLFSFYFRV